MILPASILEKTIVLRHELHRFPELSCRERETTARLMAFLRENSSLELQDRGSWFYAVYRSSAPEKRPALAFRAELDALPMEEGISLPYASQNPGVAHKCGHDGHAAVLAGFGCLLNELQPDRDVYLIFQHGEEIGAGGEECSRLLAEQPISAIYGCHNWSGFPDGQILVRPGCTHYASRGLTVHFIGSPAHASQPEDGKNPASALSALTLRALELAGPGRRNSPLCLATVVGLEAGGKNFGMSAARGSLSLTLRAEREEDLLDLHSRILQQAAELAAAEGLTLEHEDLDVFPETCNDAAAAQNVLRAAAALNLPHAALPAPFRSSEDFGYFLKKCPGAMFYIGNGTDYPEIHTTAFDFPDRHLQTMLAMFAQLCLQA